MKSKKKDDKELLFAAEYVANGSNGTKAAISAGYAEKSAHVTASRLLRKPKVAAEIERLQLKHSGKLGITTDRVLGEIAKLAFMDPRKFFNADGSPKDITELDDDTAASLAGMEVAEMFEGSGEARKFVGFVKKFKLADKGINLERLGRHLKLFTDKVEHSLKPITLVHSVPRPQQKGS